MKSILLIGLGRFGRHIAIKLDELHHQVMAVDKEDTRVDAVLPFVTNAQIGDATNEDFLSSLGVGNFDVCIVAIGDNFQNSLEVTSLLKELGAKMVVSRAARDVHAKFLLRNGADEIVYPERQLADWVAIRYSADHIFDYIELDEEHAIFEISIPGEWIGKTIGQLDIRKKYNVNIMALKTNDIMNLKISSDTQLLKDSTMLVLGDMKDFVLLIVVLAAFIYGYFLMEKLDKFLKENQSQKLISDSKLRIGFETPAIIDSIADLLEQFSSEYPNYELDLFYGSVSEIINGLGNNKLDFGFIIENSNDILKDEYCSLSLQIKQSVITPGSIDIAVHPINTIEKPARVIWQNDINCMKGLFVEKLRDFSERFLLSATRPNGKKEEKVV